MDKIVKNIDMDLMVEASAMASMDETMSEDEDDEDN